MLNLDYLPNLPPEANLSDVIEHASVGLATTILPQLVSGICPVIGCEAGGILARAEAADVMDWKFERMKEMAGGDISTFVLAHLRLPHEPYVYYADCSHREPYWPAGFRLLGDAAAIQGYLDQIRCANRKLATIVDSILGRSNRRTLILLQADHGHGRSGKPVPLEEVSPNYLRERTSVFSGLALARRLGLGHHGLGDCGQHHQAFASTQLRGPICRRSRM